MPRVPELGEGRPATLKIRLSSADLGRLRAWRDRTGAPMAAAARALLRQALDGLDRLEVRQ